MAPEQQENKAPEEEMDLDSNFKDAGGESWKVRLSVPLVDQFCAEENLPFGSFSPSRLTQHQLLTLAHRGTRWMTKAQKFPMTREDFMRRLCDDDGQPTEAYSAAVYAALQAVGNFILRSTVPSARMKDAVRMTKTEQEKQIKAVLGAAEMS